MSRSHSTFGRLAATSALAVMLVTLGAPAESRERAAGARGAPAAGAAQSRRPAGGNWTRTTETRRTETGRTRSDRWEGANGATATRDLEVSRDRAAGTSTRSVDATGFDGRSASVDSTRTRTDNGFTSQRTVVTPNGATVQHDIVKACDKAAGGCTTTVTHQTTPPAQP